MTKPAPDVRALLLAHLAPLAGRKVAVLLSGGLDSTAILHALLELQAAPACYTYTLAGRRSTDASVAAGTCRRLDIPHRLVYLPTDVQAMEADLRAVIRLGLTSKTAIECFWPMLHLLPAAAADGHTDLATGHAADGHFGLTRQFRITHRAGTRGHTVPLAALDADRRAKLSDPGFSQVDTLTAYGTTCGLAVWTPFTAPAMCQAFLGTPWETINRPAEKQPIRDAYPQAFTGRRINSHNLQQGDSGLQPALARLLQVPHLNVSGWRSVTGLYRHLARQEGQL